MGKVFSYNVDPLCTVVSTVMIRHSSKTANESSKVTVITRLTLFLSLLFFQKFSQKQSTNRINVTKMYLL